MSPAHRISGTNEWYCHQHGKRGPLGIACSLCAVATRVGALPPRVGPPESRVKRPKAGAMAEIAMRAVLDSMGYVSIEHAERDTQLARIYVAEFTFAPHERNWRCDFALPAYRVAIEVDGGSHAAGKSKQRTDTEKRGELAARGYRVVAVTPEEVKDGTARDRVARALGVSK